MQSPTEGPKAGLSPSENKDWGMLGVGTTDPKAEAWANNYNRVVYYIKSRGLLADLIRGGTQLLFRNSLASRQFASQHLQHAQGGNIYTHSEGTLTLRGAIEHLNVDGTLVSELNIDFRGPLISKSTAESLAASIDATSSYILNISDPVGFLATSNPLMMPVYGALGVLTLATYHATDFYPENTP